MKEPDTRPFDRARIPPKQNFLIMPLLWLYCWLSTRSGRLKIERVDMKGLKPPYLVLGTHQAFQDFCVTPLAIFPHRANYVSELEGFEHYGEWPYRQLGCLGTRKFINDPALVRNAMRIMRRRGVLVIYPEARYANVGTASELPPSAAKLVKLLKVPVIVVQMHGNYLQSPIWNLRRRSGARLYATATQVYTAEQVEQTPVEEIAARLQKELSYDEYAWQWEKKIRIAVPWRAEGLEHALYQCPACRREFSMRSRGAELHCRSCGGRWRMSEYGRLERTDGGENPFSSIPDWYEWERRRVEQSIDEGHYQLSLPVHVEALPNAVNFIDLGYGMLRQDATGFFLTLRDWGEKKEKTLHFPARSMPSVHTEYDYRGKGECITLSVPDNTYFLYPRGAGFGATKIQFATEYFYHLARREKQGGRCEPMTDKI